MDDGRSRTETELTSVVLNRDVIGQQLMLTSHPDEQRTSSPVGIGMKERREQESGQWREGMKRIRACRHRLHKHGVFVI